MSKPLDGRVAVVTGAARGIGDAIATTLVDAGARVFSLDMIAPEAPRPGISDIRADVTSPDSVKAAFAAVDIAAGQIDILVNNAGIQRAGLVGQISFENWMAVINTHLTGFFLCASEVVPRMVRRQRGGAIVSISSVAAFQGLPGRGPYCAAKAGILGLTRALSLEVATVNIRVNAICPGYTQTKLIEQGFGWAKTVGGIRQVMVRGLKRVDHLFVLTMTAYNLTRMRSLGQIRPQAL